MTWECSGFERNEKGEVTIIWECTNCGAEVKAGLDKPTIPCPGCHFGPIDDVEINPYFSPNSGL